MNIVLIVGLNFFDLSNVTHTLVVYITYNMDNRDLPDIYAHALGPAALGLGYIYIRQIPLAHVITYTHIYNIYIYIYIYIYHTAKVVLYSRDRYEIIGLCNNLVTVFA